MARYVRADGITLDLQPPAAPTAIVADQPGDIRARRAALDPFAFDSRTRLGLAAYRAAVAIDPRLRLMLAMRQPAGPPDWADIGLLPPSEDPQQIAALAGRLRAEGWLRPDAASRVAFSLPGDPERQVAALRLAQRQGASAFALCPQPPALPPPAALAVAFSSASYPYKP
jgi:hypothetical protein